MNRGVLLVAHNNQDADYYKMAVITARRVNQFLNLPVSIITDESSVSNLDYNFDNTILVDPNRNNYRKSFNWINKNRYRVYELSPYDDTLVLDVDYLINSSQLLKSFTIDSDFICHNDVRWFFDMGHTEYLHARNFKTLWATVMRFKKGPRAQQIFQLIQMVQDNYEHYANIYKFMPYTFRNDYALTIALKTVNGHLYKSEDFYPWKLLHVSNAIKVYRETDTSYVFMIDDKSTNKKAYLKVKDTDFHMLHKKNFLEVNT